MRNATPVAHANVSKENGKRYVRNDHLLIVVVSRSVDRLLLLFPLRTTITFPMLFQNVQKKLGPEGASNCDPL